jgi:DNA-binding transcriptional regulator YiaG
MKKPLPQMTAAELRSIREETLKVSQAAMAELLGVDIRSYQRWEAGDRSIPGPAILLAKRIAKEK